MHEPARKKLSCISWTVLSEIFMAILANIQMGAHGLIEVDVRGQFVGD